jgi:hypothetical protein
MMTTSSARCVASTSANVEDFCNAAEEMFLDEMTGRYLQTEKEKQDWEELMVQRHRGRQQAAQKQRLRNLAEVTQTRAKAVEEREVVFRAAIDAERRADCLQLTALGEASSRTAELAIQLRIRADMKVQETSEWVLARRREKARWKREAEDRTATCVDEETARRVIEKEQHVAWPPIVEAMAQDRLAAKERETTRIERQRREVAGQRRLEEQAQEKAEREEAQRLAAIARFNLEQTKARDRVEQMAMAARKHVKTERSIYTKLFEEAIVVVERPYLQAHQTLRAAVVRLNDHLHLQPKVSVSLGSPADIYNGHVSFIGSAEVVLPFKDCSVSLALPQGWSTLYNELAVALKNADTAFHVAHNTLVKGIAAWRGHVDQWKAQLVEATMAAAVSAAQSVSASAEARKRSFNVQRSPARPATPTQVADTSLHARSQSPVTLLASDSMIMQPSAAAAAAASLEQSLGMELTLEVLDAVESRLSCLAGSHRAERLPPLPPAEAVTQLKLAIASTSISAAALRAVPSTPQDDGAETPRKRGGKVSLQQSWPFHPAAAKALQLVLRPTVNDAPEPGDANAFDTDAFLEPREALMEACRRRLTAIGFANGDIVGGDRPGMPSVTAVEYVEESRACFIALDDASATDATTLAGRYAYQSVYLLRTDASLQPHLRAMRRRRASLSRQREPSSSSSSSDSDLDDRGLLPSVSEEPPAGSPTEHTVVFAPSKAPEESRGESSVEEKSRVVPLAHLVQIRSNNAQLAPNDDGSVTGSVPDSLTGSRRASFTMNNSSTRRLRRGSTAANASGTGLTRANEFSGLTALADERLVSRHYPEDYKALLVGASPDANPVFERAWSLGMEEVDRAVAVVLQELREGREADSDVVAMTRQTDCAGRSSTQQQAAAAVDFG